MHRLIKRVSHGEIQCKKLKKRENLTIVAIVPVQLSMKEMERPGSEKKGSWLIASLTTSHCLGVDTRFTRFAKLLVVAEEAHPKKDLRSIKGPSQTPAIDRADKVKERVCPAPKDKVSHLPVVPRKKGQILQLNKPKKSKVDQELANLAMGSLGQTQGSWLTCEN